MFLLGLLAVLNSFCFDYLTRFRTAGTHLNWTYISRVAVPARSALDAIPAIPTRFSEELGNVESVYDCPDLFASLWAANKAIALAYGLNSSDFEHILNAFPVFARKRPKFHDFLLRQLREWKSEES